MTITQETVQHVAKLARLELAPDEAQRYTQDLANILGLVEQLNELNLDQVSLELSVTEPAILREDKPTRNFDRAAVLKQAPCEEEGFFRVPKILSE